MTYLPTYLEQFGQNSGKIMTKEIKNHNGPALFEEKVQKEAYQ